MERLAVQIEARLCTVPISAGPAKRLSHHRGRSSQGLRLGLRGFERAFFVVGSFRGAEIRRGLDKAQASSPSVACFGSPILALASLQFPSSQVAGGSGPGPAEDEASAASASKTVARWASSAGLSRAHDVAQGVKQSVITSSTPNIF